MSSGYFIRKIGVFIIWLMKGFQGSFYEIEKKHYKYDFIIGLIFLCLVAYFIM